MRLSNLADHLRAWGLDVVEVEGWKTRGKPFPAAPRVVVAHHTATKRSATKDYPSLAVVRDGRSDLPGPLSQLGIGYSGKVYVIASGVSNHAGKGAWQGISVGNSKSVGIEAESPGDGTWTDAQRKTYPLLCAALCDLLGSPASLVCGHKESALPQGRKVDPAGIHLGQLRSQTAALLRRGKPKPKPAPAPTFPPEEARMIVKFEGSGTFYEVVGSHLEALTKEAYAARKAHQRLEVRTVPASDPLSKLPKR